MARTLRWSTEDTKLASCLAGLGFPVATSIIEHSRSNKVITQWLIGDRSPWHPHLTRSALLKMWRDPRPKENLETQDPLHPFLQGLRAQHNYDCLLDAQNHGRRLRLVGTPGSYASLYTDGDELPTIKAAKLVIEISDLSLAAALGTLGIPVIEIKGTPGFHSYVLPARAHWLKAWPSGNMIQYDAASIAQRAMPGQIHLALEKTDPSHPLVAAYQARHAHNVLKRHLGQAHRQILVTAPGTQRCAIIGENAVSRVQERVENHLEGG